MNRWPILMTMQHKIIVPVFWALLVTVGSASAEVYAYLDQQGRRYYVDKSLDDLNYRPVNSAARTARLGLAQRLRRPAQNRLASETDRQEINRLIEKWATYYTLDPALVKAVVEVESGYSVRAHSKANAQGLMQLIPGTARRFGVDDPWNAEQNLRGGMAYLQFLLSKFKGDLRLVLSAYNAGENNVVKYAGVPPFKETQRYLAKVGQIYKKRWHAYSQNKL